MYCIQALRYVRPPDTLLTQLDVYTEEKFEDEEEMRERAISFTRARQADHAGHVREASDSHQAFGELVTLAKRHMGVYPLVIESLKSYAKILERDLDESVLTILQVHYLAVADVAFDLRQFTCDLFFVLQKFTENATVLDDLSVHLFVFIFWVDQLNACVGSTDGRVFWKGSLPLWKTW